MWGQKCDISVWKVFITPDTRKCVCVRAEEHGAFCTSSVKVVLSVYIIYYYTDDDNLTEVCICMCVCVFRGELQ